MKVIQSLLASTAMLASLGAHAGVTPSLTATSGDFMTLSSSTRLLGGKYAITGGTIYNTDQPFASDPSQSNVALYGGNFLATGPSSGASATIDFGTTGIDFISFLWGSPDTFNNVKITGTGGFSQTLTPSDLDFSVTDGNQAFAQYVSFTGTAGTMITSLMFDNVPAADAFEVANFSVTPVPEPETYALMLAGLGATAFIARRCKSS